MGKKAQCYVCGGNDRLLPYDSGKYHLCIHCETNVEFWEGLPVLEYKPDCCPFCGDEDLTQNGIGMDYQAKFDDELAIDLGIEYDPFEYNICNYIFDCVACEGECGEGFWVNIPYGERRYWSGGDDFENVRPMNTKERQAHERKKLIDAGQLSLFGDE